MKIVFKVLPLDAESDGAFEVRSTLEANKGQVPQGVQ